MPKVPNDKNWSHLPKFSMLYNIVLVNSTTLHKMLSQLISDLKLLAADHTLSLSLSPREPPRALGIAYCRVLGGGRFLMGEVPP